MHRIAQPLVRNPWRFVIPLVAYAAIFMGRFQLKDINLVLGAVFDFGEGAAADV